MVFIRVVRASEVGGRHAGQQPSGGNSILIGFHGKSNSVGLSFDGGEHDWHEVKPSFVAELAKSFGFLGENAVPKLLANSTTP